jgi:hypothetical protein
MELANADRERPIAYASVPKKPETAKRDVSIAERSATPLALPPQYRTHIRLFVQETGAELGFLSGTSCEIRGYVIANGARTNVSVDLPEKTNFASENGGLGRIVLDVISVTRFLPANFTGLLYEEGNSTTGDRKFTNAAVDWNTAPQEWANGNPWWFSQTVSNDQNFKGHLWWQVSSSM